MVSVWSIAGWITAGRNVCFNVG